jgi:hypothetical protein
MPERTCSIPAAGCRGSVLRAGKLSGTDRKAALGVGPFEGMAALNDDEQIDRRLVSDLR